MPEGIEDLIIDEMDSITMCQLVQEFHNDTRGYDFSEFKKYLLSKGVRIIGVPQVDILFSEKE